MQISAALEANPKIQKAVEVFCLECAELSMSYANAFRAFMNETNDPCIKAGEEVLNETVNKFIADFLTTGRIRAEFFCDILSIHRALVQITAMFSLVVPSRLTELYTTLNDKTTELDKFLHALIENRN